MLSDEDETKNDIEPQQSPVVHIRSIPSIIRLTDQGSFSSSIEPKQERDEDVSFLRQSSELITRRFTGSNSHPLKKLSKDSFEIFNDEFNDDVNKIVPKSTPKKIIRFKKFYTFSKNT